MSIISNNKVRISGFIWFGGWYQTLEMEKK